MKKYVHADKPVTCQIDVVFEVELCYAPTDKQVAASSYKGFHVPDGELLPEEKDAIITSQAYADWLAFNESVEDLITDYYELDIVYKNQSPDNSFYFGVMARNSDNSFILKFSATFRIANHAAHRSKSSQFNKKAQKDAIANLIDGKKLQVIYKPIIVNQNTFSSYYEAFAHVSDEIEKASKVLKRDMY